MTINILFSLRTELELFAQRWQGYDELYENLTQWVKSTEAEVRIRNKSFADLQAKQKQLQFFEVRQEK